MKDREKWLFSSSPIMEAIVRLAFPTVIGQIILVIYNMADTFFIGLTGSDAHVTAVTVCMPAFMFLSAISNLFGVGGSSVIARSLGQEKFDRVKQASSFALWGCLLTTALYSLGAWLLIHPFVDILGGTDPSVHATAVQYLLITVVLGGMGASLSALFGHLVRSEGRSLQASVGIALGGILNIGLDPLFMFVLLPRGNEVLGAAVATALSNLISLAFFLFIIFRRGRHSVLGFRPSARSLKDGVPGDIFSAGLPACLMTLFENISFTVLDKLMSASGVMMQAGLGVAKKVNMLAHSIARGMAQGVLPLIGYNYASGDHRRMRNAVLLSAGISVGLATLFMAACLAFSRPMIELFIQSGSHAVTYGARFLRILCIGGPFSACAYAFISFFQATGMGRRSFLLAILRKGLLDIPMMFALNSLIPLYGIVWATPITDILCCGVSIALFASFLRTHTNLGGEKICNALRDGV